MTKLRFLCALWLSAALAAQKPVPRMAVAPPAEIQAALTRALVGQWAGVLEYRDYSEPDTSTKRVQLPTWLTISADGGKLIFHYTYDDGPAKIVEDTDTVTLDVAASTYTITSAKGRSETYHAEGYDSLHAGLGAILIVGPSQDNGRPVETHIAIAIRRNYLSFTEENRPSSITPFAFRHRYVFTRAQPPAAVKP